MRGEILSKSVVSRPSEDPNLTISQISNLLQIDQNGPIPQTVQIWPSGQASGLEPQDPRGARFDSWWVFQPTSRCFWGGAKAFSAGNIDLPQN